MTKTIYVCDRCDCECGHLHTLSIGVGVKNKRHEKTEQKEVCLTCLNEVKEAFYALLNPLPKAK